MGKLFDSYRPERHYMRGPGPRWHAKHGGGEQPAVEQRLELPLATWLLPATAALLGLAAVVALA